MPIILKCKMCGGDLNIQPGASTAECLYCGTLQTIPNIDNEKRANLFDRANHYRRNNDFDKALSIYEQLVSEDNTDAEAHWSAVLCKYGIEYVEDPRSHRRIPTVNRAQYISILNDPDYVLALKYADSQQYPIYQHEAQVIDNIQKGILEISRKEAPFDIFICYKETDSKGNRTLDSVIAYEIYEELINKGYRVFFARVTLEDKLGIDYEPYIFAALNSAKIMLVIGTSSENINSVWVKNEWSRYLALMSGNKDKRIIPVYKDMDPYDLPEQFVHLQAQDYGKLGAIQDIVRGVDKILSKPEKDGTALVSSDASVTVASLLKRAEQFIDQKQWNNAAEYCNRILDSNPECAMAYFYLFITEAKALSYDEIIAGSCDPSESTNFMSAVKYAVGDEKEQFKTILTEYEKAHRVKKAKIAKRNFIIKIVSTVLVAFILCFGGVFTYNFISRKNELQKKEAELQQSYLQAEALFEDEKYADAKTIYDSLEHYNDSDEKSFRCEFEKIKTNYSQKDVSIFEEFVKNDATHDEAVRFLEDKADEHLKRIQSFDGLGENKSYNSIIVAIETIRDYAIECLEVAGYDDKSQEICEIKYQFVKRAYDSDNFLRELNVKQLADLEYLASVNYKDSAEILKVSESPRTKMTFEKESFSRSEHFDVSIEFCNFISGYLYAIFPDGSTNNYTLTSDDIIYGCSMYYYYNIPEQGVTGTFTIEIYTSDGQFVNKATCQITK